MSRSGDLGTTWQPLSLDVGSEFIMAVAVTPQGTVLATSQDGMTSRMFTSEDRGETWIERNLSTNLFIDDLKTTRTGHIFVHSIGGDESQPGIFVSEDEGVSWTRFEIHPNERTVFVFISPKDSVLVVTRDSLYGWDPRTKSVLWRSNEPIPGPHLLHQIVWLDDQRLAALANSGKIWLSQDGGRNWQESEFPVIGDCLLEVVDGNILAVQKMNVGSSVMKEKLNLYMVDFDGEKWQQGELPFHAHFVRSLLHHPQNLLWLATSSGLWRARF